MLKVKNAPDSAIRVSDLPKFVLAVITKWGPYPEYIGRVVMWDSADELMTVGSSDTRTSWGKARDLYREPRHADLKVKVLPPGTEFVLE